MSKARSAAAQAETVVKLIVGAGQASPAPPIGPALGSKGVKAIDFCKEFNALTAHMIPGTPIPAIVTVRPDRTFHFTLRTPPTASLLLAAAGVKPSKGGKVRGANAPGRTPEAVVNTSTSTALPASVPGSLPAGRSRSASANTELDAGPAGSGVASAPRPSSEVGQGVVKMVARAAGGDKEPGKGGGSTQVGEISLKHVYEIAKIKQSEPRLAGADLKGLCKSVIGQARSVGVGVVP